MNWLCCQGLPEACKEWKRWTKQCYSPDPPYGALSSPWIFALLMLTRSRKASRNKIKRGGTTWRSTFHRSSSPQYGRQHQDSHQSCQQSSLWITLAFSSTAKRVGTTGPPIFEILMITREVEDIKGGDRQIYNGLICTTEHHMRVLHNVLIFC